MMGQDILAGQDLPALFKWFHRHPELGHEEKETTAKLKEILQQAGVTFLPWQLPTGTAVVIAGAKPGKTILLRADIDALPLTEKTTLSYKSETPGVMHACGHDFHMTSVLGAALLLQARRQELQGRVLVVFQPAEETSGGAVEVLRTGIAGDATEFWGLHVTNALPVGTLGLSTGSVMASVDSFKVTVTGKGTHGATPEKGNNPLPILAGLVQELPVLAQRHVDPLHAKVLSITHVEGGNTWNVIPETAFLEGTLRCQDPEDRQVVKQAFYAFVEKYTAARGATSKILWHRGPAPVVNDAGLVNFAAKLARQKGWQVSPVQLSMAGDDFSYYKELGGKDALSLYMKIGIGGAHPIHDPAFQADPAALVPTAQFLADLLAARLR
jgi:amidohydrolase